MRKLNREKQVFTNGAYTVLVERIKNDINGNPRYQLDVIENRNYIGTYNISTYYGLEEYIEEQVFTGKFLEW